MKVKSIVIVGGGSSGWCSAAALAKFCPGIKITVIESDTVPTIGVGESTIQYFNTFIKLLGIEDKDWMKYCSATYKGAIKFTDFNKGQHYYAPFKFLQNNFEFNKRLENWAIISAVDNSITPDLFAKYIWNGSYLLDQNKITTINNTLDFKLEDNTSYNLDASKFGEYLKEFYCKPRGVEHITDTVTVINKDENGFITDLNEKYIADLYIDCTGFSSLLLEKTMGSEFKPYDELFNDRAVVFNNIAYKDKDSELEMYTNTIAQDYGWVWNIPLWNRISNGYVFSKKFTTDEQALNYLHNHVTTVRGKDRADSQTPFYVDIKNGRHEKAWIKNVVGIGLSYGFIEPLGSTGLLLTQRGIIRLITQLNARNFDYNSFDIENFNVASADLLDSLKDFYLIHFITTTREDTAYWKHIKYNLIPHSDSFKRINQKIAYTISETSGYLPIDLFHWQLFGMGYNSYNIDMFKNFVESGDITAYGKRKAAEFNREFMQYTLYTAELPSLLEYLQSTIYAEV
jgi:tryptophan halogenase